MMVTLGQLKHQANAADSWAESLLFVYLGPSKNNCYIGLQPRVTHRQMCLPSFCSVLMAHMTRSVSLGQTPQPVHHCQAPFHPVPSLMPKIPALLRGFQLVLA